MAYALAWCGWKVEPVDWPINPEHDLSDLKVQGAAAIQTQTCDAAIWAVGCSTLSRAREIPIPDNKQPPRPLRAEDQPRGLQTLHGHDSERVKQANLLRFHIQAGS